MLCKDSLIPQGTVIHRLATNRRKRNRRIILLQTVMGKFIEGRTLLPTKSLDSLLSKIKYELRITSYILVS